MFRMNVMCYVKLLVETLDVDIREQRVIGNEFKTKFKKKQKNELLVLHHHLQVSVNTTPTPEHEGSKHIYNTNVFYLSLKLK